MRFWQELRRRRVFRLAGLYVVGAWLVVQVADIVLPAWALPETAMRYLIIAATLCFPIALVFAWFYDITADGIVRTQPAGDTEVVDAKLKRSDYAILAALLFIAGTILVSSVDRIVRTAPEIAGDVGVPDKAPNSLAVLPFENLDPNPDTAYFSNGVSEELLHKLASIKALKVLGRKSSFAFRDSELGAKRISDALGVAYLLLGSVRRDEARVRVTASLVDEDGFQVWSDSFDRELHGIFEIQSEIAGAVSRHITETIVPGTDTATSRTTSNMEAYNQYLLGRALFDARTAGWRNKAIAAFRKAIELDGDFAPPYAGLAMALAVNQEAEGPHIDEAIHNAQKSLELDPELAEGKAILGLLKSFGGEFEDGAALLKHALDLNPSLGIAYNWLQFSLQGLELHDEAAKVLEAGVERDPHNPPMVANVSAWESRLGNFERAEQLLLRLTILPEPPLIAYPRLAELYDTWGQLAKATAVSKQALLMDLEHGELGMVFGLAHSYESLGITQDADFWAAIWEERIGDDESRPFLALDLYMRRGANDALEELIPRIDQTTQLGQRNLGIAHIWLGNYEQGIATIETLVGEPDVFRLLSFVPTGEVIFVMRHLAFAYAQVGRVADSQRLLQQIHDVVDSDPDKFSKDPMGYETRALNRALLGNKSGAYEALEHAVELGWADYYTLINDPAWAETIEAPEFQALLDKVKAKVDQQRAIVEQADAQHDFRAEFESLWNKAFDE